MYGTFDVNPSADVYRNTPAEMARVMGMVHRRTDGAERDQMIRMLFAPVRRVNP